MKNILIRLSFMSSFMLAIACGDNQPTSETSALPPANAVRLASFTNGCAPGSTPRLTFFGYDSSGRASYTVETPNFSSVSTSSCDLVASLQIDRGFRARIKGVSYSGSYFRSNGTFGSVDIFTGLRTSLHSTVQQPVPLATTTFSKSDFSMGPNNWTQCSKQAFPGETLLVRPSTTIRGGIAGQTPSLSASLNFVTISLEVESCTP